MIQFSCVSCSRPYRVSRKMAGRAGSCRDCGADLTVPTRQKGGRAARRSSKKARPNRSRRSTLATRTNRKGEGRFEFDVVSNLYWLIPAVLTVLLTGLYCMMPVRTLGITSSLSIIGTLMSLAALCRTAMVAAEDDSIVEGFLCLVTPYFFYYVLTRWTEHRRVFLNLFVAGALILVPCRIVERLVISDLLVTLANQ